MSYKEQNHPKEQSGHEEQHKYDDMIYLPHHVSANHPQMPLPDRAAQFAPFAALTGFDATVREAARTAETYQESEKSNREQQQ